MNNVAALAEVRPTSAIDMPDTKVVAREAFDIDTDMVVPAFSVRTEHVPDIDTAYKFDRETTLAILAGFAFNRRTMIQGYHGTAARAGRCGCTGPQRTAARLRAIAQAKQAGSP